MKKSFFALAVLVVGLLVLTACGGGGNSPVIGTWERSAGTSDWVYEFNQDSSLVITVNGNSDNAGIGTWSVEDNRLSISRTNEGAWLAVNSYTFRVDGDTLILREAWGDEIRLTRAA